MSTPKRLLSLLKHARRHLGPVIFVSVVVVLMILELVFRQQIHNQLESWKLLPQPEPLTELYFTHPNSLPSTYTPNQIQRVTFTVHDLEYKTITYSYSVNEISSSPKSDQLLNSGYFKLKQNQIGNIVAPVLLYNDGKRVQVKITIVMNGMGETIDYWVEEAS